MYCALPQLTFPCPPPSQGLGKTLEIIALIASRPKPNPEPEVQEWDYTDLDHIVREDPLRASTVGILHTKTTLVVCPLTILKQWTQQLEDHAPNLTFTVYKTEKLLDGDVVEGLDKMRRRCGSLSLPPSLPPSPPPPLSLSLSPSLPLSLFTLGGMDCGPPLLWWCSAIGVMYDISPRLQPGLSQISFFLQDSPQGQPPRTANRHPPPTPTNHQPPTINRRRPPPTANRQPPPTANCQLLTYRRPREREAESVPVNLRFCWGYEPFPPPLRTARPAAKRAVKPVATTGPPKGASLVIAHVGPSVPAGALAHDGGSGSRCGASDVEGNWIPTSAQQRK